VADDLRANGAGVMSSWGIEGTAADAPLLVASAGGPSSAPIVTASSAEVTCSDRVQLIYARKTTTYVFMKIDHFASAFIESCSYKGYCKEPASRRKRCQVVWSNSGHGRVHLRCMPAFYLAFEDQALVRDCFAA
jgi:hypothetical protein